MIQLAQISGGADSLALALWMIEQGIEFTAVHLLTGWEHPLTDVYIDELDERLFDGKLVRLRSEEYEGFEDLVLKKGVFPRRTMRFCTEHLKLKPLWKYIESLDDEVTSNIGERAEESPARAAKPIRQWVNEAGGYWLQRPIHTWTKIEVFEIAKRHSIPHNPLYTMGAGRVGCWPCAFISLRELRALLISTPEIKERIRSLETRMAARLQRRQPGQLEWASPYFFPSGKIPARFCSQEIPTKAGTIARVPTCDDVFSYLESTDENQLPLIEAPRCMSIYNLCE